MHLILPSFDFVFVVGWKLSVRDKPILRLIHWLSYTNCCNTTDDEPTAVAFTVECDDGGRAEKEIENGIRKKREKER